MQRLIYFHAHTKSCTVSCESQTLRNHTITIPARSQSRVSTDEIERQVTGKHLCRLYISYLPTPQNLYETETATLASVDEVSRELCRNLAVKTRVKHLLP